MQFVKKIVIATVLATVSLTAVAAESAGAAKVRAAVENTIEKIQEAIQMSEQAGTEEEISKAIGEARQLQKEFRFEGTERSRQKANEKLRVARETLKTGDHAGANVYLKDALKDFMEMKATYNLGIK
jgi:hypothetical protein